MIQGVSSMHCPQEARFEIAYTLDGILLSVSHDSVVLSPAQSTFTGPNGDDNEGLHRALADLDKHGQYDPFIPWLSSLLKHKDERIRSKAVKLLCKALPDRRLIEEQLRSSDSRIRANAVEALWFHQSPTSQSIFYNALSDPYHRVVVNALIGLYYQNDPTAMQTLLSLSKHSSEHFRAAAIWAFIHLYDYRAVAALRALLGDSCEVIRKKARVALSTLLWVGDRRTMLGN